jgi:hypothetical protein
MTEEYAFEKFGAEEDGWDHETGAPGIILFSNAVQVWTRCQKYQPVSFADVAEAFNVPGKLVVEAVDFHPWLSLYGSGDDFKTTFVEHLGE